MSINMTFSWKNHPEVEAYLRENCSKMPPLLLTDAINSQFNLALNVCQVRNTIIRLGLSTGLSKGNPNIRYFWTEDKIKFLQENTHLSRKETLELFNSKFNANLTLKALDSAKYVYKVKQTTKPKCKPLPLGTLKIRYNTEYIKTSDNTWNPKARLVWEAFNGPIPKGYVIYYKDGNTMNSSLDNLDCMPRKVATSLHQNKLPYNETSKTIAEACCTLREMKKEIKK